MPFPADLPPHDEYADVFDADDWNRRIEGSMGDYADNAEPTVVMHMGHEVTFGRAEPSPT